MPTDSKGVATTSLDEIERFIIDFAETVEQYPDAAFEWMPFVQTFSMVGQSGNTREVIYSNNTGALAPELAEGQKPEFRHGEFERQLVTVKKYGEALGITEEMLEDSRLDEMGAAVEATTAGMLNRYTERFFDELRSGVYGTDDVPARVRRKTWAAASDHSYDADHDGVAVTQSRAGHDYSTGSTKLYLGDINLAIRHITEHGFSPDTLLLTEAMLQQISDLAGFTKEMVGARQVDEVAEMGVLTGRLQGLDVVLVSGGWLEDDEIIITDRASRPLIFLEKRRMRVDNYPSNEGTIENFDLTAASMSARFGFDTKRPHRGATVVLHVREDDPQ